MRWSNAAGRSTCSAYDFGKKMTSTSDFMLAAADRPGPAFQRPVAVWLFALTALVAAMVLLGGATRLTDSGLSITEWAPVTGALPPFGEAAWRAEFEKYKQIPEYGFVNWGMSLAEFKTIYWWEWAHRLMGRVIGLAALLPLIFFAARGAISRSLGLKLAGVVVLIGAQGALGWWMVASGLTERVDVSQYRLAAHLGLAVALFGLLLWLALDYSNKRRAKPLKLAPWAATLSLAVYGQIILGAFVAGLRAGGDYNTWPLMDGALVPVGYFAEGPRFLDLFETVAATQFNHRLGAYLVAAAAVAFWLAARRSDIAPVARALALAVAAQAVLGIVTVLNATPIALGLAHQAGALFVFATAVTAFYGCVGEISMRKPSSSSG